MSPKTRDPNTVGLGGRGEGEKLTATQESKHSNTSKAQCFPKPQREGTIAKS